MGLDAVVFRNIHWLEDRFGYGLFDVDPTTGEGLLKPGIGIQVPREAYYAVKKRLGNLAEINSLRTIVIGSPIGGDSFVVRRILYCGTHSGDSIELNELSLLAEELCVLDAENPVALHSFVEAVQSLVTCAIAEDNPIVFV